MQDDCPLFKCLEECRQCIRCKAAKPIEMFRIFKRNHRRSRSCRQCLNLLNREYRKRQTTKGKKTHRSEEMRQAKRRGELRRKYGISLVEYKALQKQQNGVCAICGQPESFAARSLCVDHDHADGRVRGLLCDNCNRGLGAFKDREDWLARAIAYLRQHKLCQRIA